MPSRLFILVTREFLATRYAIMKKVGLSSRGQRYYCSPAEATLVYSDRKWGSMVQYGSVETHRAFLGGQHARLLQFHRLDAASIYTWYPYFVDLPTIVGAQKTHLPTGSLFSILIVAELVVSSSFRLRC